MVKMSVKMYAKVTDTSSPHAEKIGEISQVCDDSIYLQFTKDSGCWFGFGQIDILYSKPLG